MKYMIVYINREENTMNFGGLTFWRRMIEKIKRRWKSGSKHTYIVQKKESRYCCDRERG